MDGIYEWVRSLVSYMVLMTMVINLLPNRKYEKYIRLFTGMVFLLLVVSPFTNLTGTAAQMAGAFERITFQTDVKLLQKEIAALDGTRMERLAAGYTDVVEQELRDMAAELLLECTSVNVILNTDLDSAEFGTILGISMRVHAAQKLTEEEKKNKNMELLTLRGKIGEYYGVEDGNIALILEAE